MALWVAACVYTCTYAYLFAYKPDPNPKFVLGMPSWIVGGVIVPWLVCLAVTIWASLWGIQDEDLGQDAGAAGHQPEVQHG